MDIPASSIEPFGYQGFPTLEIRAAVIKRCIGNYFDSVEEYSFDELNCIGDIINNLGGKVEEMQFSLSQCATGILLLVTFTIPPNRQQWMLVDSYGSAFDMIWCIPNSVIVGIASQIITPVVSQINIAPSGIITYRITVVDCVYIIIAKII